METFFEVFVSRLWALAADQLNALNRLGRRVLTRCQIRNYVRRSGARLHTLASIRTMTNRPITFIDEPQPALREACKRLHTGEFADEAKRQELAYQESIAQGFNDLSVDFNDKIHIMEASNGGNLYGGHGTTGNKRNNDFELHAANNLTVTTSNRIKGNKMVCDSNPINGTNKDGIGITNVAGNDTTETAFDNDDIYVTDIDDTSICGASNGGNLYGGHGTSGKKMTSEIHGANNKTKDIIKMDNNDASYVNIAAVFGKSD